VSTEDDADPRTGLDRRGAEASSRLPFALYSTVTDFARFRGWSTLSPRFTAT
jgi:hypothetical protein